MNDVIIAILLVFILYIPLCLLIALIRTLFSRKIKRKENFIDTFLTFFLEIQIPRNTAALLKWQWQHAAGYFTNSKMYMIWL